MLGGQSREGRKEDGVGRYKKTTSAKAAPPRHTPGLVFVTVSSVTPAL
jgi:hypothetical protein